MKKIIFSILAVLGVLVLVAVVGCFVVIITSLSGARMAVTSFQNSEAVLSPDSADYYQGADTKSATTEVLPQRKVSRNGSMSVTVEKAEEAVETITDIAEQAGGFVSVARIYEIASDIKSGHITIKVPSDKFDETIDKIKDTTIKVEREEVSTQDVTDQYIDLETRLRNYNATEDKYLEVLKKAQTVNEILDVQRELSQIRNNIERIEGQIKYMDRQVEMSTISVSLTSEADIEVFGVRWRPLTQIKQSLRALVKGSVKYVNFMIAAIALLPLIVLWLITIAIVMLVIWKVGRWVKNRFFPRKIGQ